MENIKANDIKKTGVSENAPVIKKKETEVKKLTPSEEFLLECDEQESEIFNQVKNVLIDHCEKYEFEAVTEDNLEDYSMIITYIKNGVISLESNGVMVKLRKPLKDSDGNIIADSLKILYERNESRELVFTKGIKVSKKSIESQKEFTLATLAASFENVGNKMISLNSVKSIQANNHRDYMLLLNVYNFFRS